jgi:hypothetical protein
MLGCLVLAAIVGGALYLAGGKRHDNPGSRQPFTQAPTHPPPGAWRPQDILANPSGYLDACEHHTKAAMANLERSRAAIARKVVDLSKQQTESSRAVETLAIDLSRIKQEYRQAEASGRWPMTWKSRALSQPQAKQQIVATARQLELQQKTLAAAMAGIESLKKLDLKVQQSRDECQDQLTKIAASRAAVQVQRLSDDLKKQLIDMRTVLQAVTDDLTGSQRDLLTLDDLAAAADKEADQAKFDRIMNTP